MGLFAIGIYRSFGPALFGGSCRFEPSCSEYATHAMHEHPPLRAFKLIGTRILKCRPYGPCGVDPVPSKGVIT